MKQHIILTLKETEESEQTKRGLLVMRKTRVNSLPILIIEFSLQSQREKKIKWIQINKRDDPMRRHLFFGQRNAKETA